MDRFPPKISHEAAQCMHCRDLTAYVCTMCRGAFCDDCSDKEEKLHGDRYQCSEECRAAYKLQEME